MSIGTHFVISTSSVCFREWTDRLCSLGTSCAMSRSPSPRLPTARSDGSSRRRWRSRRPPYAWGSSARARQRRLPWQARRAALSRLARPGGRVTTPPWRSRPRQRSATLQNRVLGPVTEDASATTTWSCPGCVSRMLESVTAAGADRDIDVVPTSGYRVV